MMYCAIGNGARAAGGIIGDIFSDPALLECADNSDDDSKSQAELEDEGSATEMVEDTASNATVSSRKSKSLNKKEKAKLLEELRHISGVQQLLSSLLDSNGKEMAAICDGLADNFVCVYLNCDKGKEKYARFQVPWHQSCSKFLLPVDEHNTKHYFTTNSIVAYTH